MRPSIVTVLTHAPWESQLVKAVRERGMVRLRGRCASAGEVERQLGIVDAVVVGGETPWITRETCQRWADGGTIVVGVVDTADRPSRRLLAEAHLVVTRDTPPDRILGQIAALPRRDPRPPRNVVATVLGPRGAPGCTEVAMALAWTGSHSRRRQTALVEVDGEAPGLAMRLGLHPRRNSPIVDPLLGRGVGSCAFDGVEIVTIPIEGGPLTASVAGRVIDAARGRFDFVVVDAGPRDPGRLPFDHGIPIMVIQPSPTGLLRAARLVGEWTGAVPEVVLNRSDGDERSIRLARQATGLEPTTIVPTVATTLDGPPTPELMALMEPLIDRILARARESQVRAASSPGDDR